MDGTWYFYLKTTCFYGWQPAQHFICEFQWAFVTYSFSLIAAGFTSLMFCVGDEFKSFSDLTERISELKITQFTQLNVQRSRSIESASKQAPFKEYNEDQKYSDIDLVCVHGGKKFKTASKGEQLKVCSPIVIIHVCHSISLTSLLRNFIPY